MKSIGAYIYITIVAVAFTALAIVFDTMPRPTYSPLEKRDLASFPTFSLDKLMSGHFTRDVSHWFSDSEPFRDDFLAMSMQLKDWMRVSLGEEQLTFHASVDGLPMGDDDNAEEAMKGDGMVNGFDNSGIADGNAKIANAGILVVGSGDKVRALMAFGGSAKGGVAYANVANKYKETFGSAVNIYCMVIPTAIEYYCPEKAKKITRPQWATINNIHGHLRSDVLAVDVYTSLGQHAEEDIYLRTDHHWAPLGAFYAAKEFARVAKVPFKNLDSYTRKVVHKYVGSMYGYSKDIAIKNAPEDFVYYTPNGVKYETTYINYSIDASYHVTGMGKPVKGPFFYHFKDGNGGAYCTFMGGDTKITRVTTSTHNGRRVLILKDSFGNALPGYLFFSFEEVHVVDTRYFTKNMVEYVMANKITDILFANNIFNAYNPKFCSRYTSFLTQANQTVFHATKHENDSTKRDSISIHEAPLSQPDAKNKNEHDNETKQVPIAAPAEESKEKPAEESQTKPAEELQTKPEE